MEVGGAVTGEARERPKKRPRTESPSLSASAASDDIDDDDDASSDREDSADASHLDSSRGSSSSCHPKCLLANDPSPGLDILNRIRSGNVTLLLHLSGLKTPAGAMAAKIVVRQMERIDDLVAMFINAMLREGPRVQDGYEVFRKASDLLRAIACFFPLLTALPGDVLKLVLEQDRLIFDLRHMYLVAVGDSANRIKAPEISSPEATATPVVSRQQQYTGQW